MTSIRESCPTRGRPTFRRNVIAGLGLALPVIALLGCTTSPRDFESEGETFLESPELAKEAGYKFSNANCEQPATTAIGTTFACTATDNDGDDWEFVIEITGERELTVVSGDLVN